MGHDSDFEFAEEGHVDALSYHDPRKPGRLLTPAEKRVRFGDCNLGDVRGEYERGLVERYTAGLPLSLSDKRYARRLIREER